MLDYKKHLSIFNAILVVVFLFFPVNKAEATVDTIPTTVPFGGLILDLVICENTPILLYILNYENMIVYPIALQPWSRLNQWFAPFPGNAALGGFMPIPGDCVLNYYPYVALPYIGEVSSYPFPGMGTSLIPPVPGT